MATYDATVKKAFNAQGTLINEGEHCSADPERLANIGRAQGRQIRVKRNENEYALYTVSETRQETPDTIVRMAREGRARLTPDASEIPDEFGTIVDSQVPHPTYTDDEAETNSEFVERLADNGTHTGLVAIAPHGGEIEERTDQQAEHVASQLAAKGVSCWRCKGFRRGGGAFERWHITSPDLNEASFPLLNTIIKRHFTYAVAFHGFEQQEILIGGGADEALKCEIRSAIQKAIAGSGIEVNIATPEANFNGDNPNNIVNRLANGNGIQVEQSKAARNTYWQQIARAVASVYNYKIAPNYIWPLSKSTTPDEMNTSFGPRINRNKWDFHDGIDLPAAIGTKIHAMCEGIVYRAGPGNAGPGGFSSRHVILQVDDPTDGRMFLVYLHLHSIAEGITVGAGVAQGQLLGTVGEDDATYPHLHIEFRKGSAAEKSSVHPLGYLPYANTANFSAPVLDRFNRLDTLMAARLLLEASSKLEGDLQRVEVDLMNGATVIESRLLDFNDKSTINEGNDDTKLFKNGIGVEGYQKSDMAKDGRIGLQYGILVRNVPNECDTLIARVIDVGGNMVASAPIPMPNQIAMDEKVDFEDGAMPPAGWTALTSASGKGTTVTNDPTATHSGLRGMLCVDDSKKKSTQRAAIEHVLPTGRFEWIIEGWFNPIALDLDSGQAIDLLHCRSSGTKLSVAARIHKDGNSFRAGIIVKNPDGTVSHTNSAAVVAKDTWRKWKLHLLRIGTRETTAVLFLDDNEKLRINWDCTTHEPRKLRAGIGFSSAGATATIFADELRLTEFERSPIR
jgi:murein DD-endopeptidase MepM/ murein hydrolase activator NlpD